jgi:hypothetical protein
MRGPGAAKGSSATTPRKRLLGSLVCRIGIIKGLREAGTRMNERDVVSTTPTLISAQRLIYEHFPLQSDRAQRAGRTVVTHNVLLTAYSLCSPWQLNEQPWRLGLLDGRAMVDGSNGNGGARHQLKERCFRTTDTSKKRERGCYPNRDTPAHTKDSGFLQQIRRVCKTDG